MGDSTKQGPTVGLTYADAGVDIDAGNDLVQRIKPLVRATRRPGADAEIGGFGGLFDLKAAGFSDPILVAANDGVGSKVKIAIETGLHATIGIDLVAMCVNDLDRAGRRAAVLPGLFRERAARRRRSARPLVEGIAAGCREAGAALIGGETAEMPGLYAGRDYDLAGFAVGAAERGALLPRATSRRATSSSGCARPACIPTASRWCAASWPTAASPGTAPAPFAPGESLAAALLAPTRIYVRPLLAALRAPARASRRWPTSPAAVSPRTFRASCRARLRRGHRPRRRSRCRRCSAGSPGGRRRRGGDAAHLQLRDRHGRRRRGGGGRTIEASCATPARRRCASAPGAARGGARTVFRGRLGL